MSLTRFSDKFPNEFLSRTEDNFNVLQSKLSMFYRKTRADIRSGNISRRNLDMRFNYEEELKNVKINQKGITTEEVAFEFNDILQGSIRHQDPKTAFNLIPAPLLDTIAGITLMGLYNPNSCWDFISGKLCLYEKKIVRMLGVLVNWPQADGYVVTGGKQALLYAIKNGMGRASAQCAAETSDFVVICSELAHYSINHVCHYLGIDQENCIRIPTHASGEVNLQILEKTLDQVIAQGKVVAAVIAVGGGTINFFQDPIFSIKEMINHAVTKHKLNYTPYLHADAVISWAWLAFDEDALEAYQNLAYPRVEEKIKTVVSKLRDIEYADSFAADFHKTGFCPYAAGVFVTKESENLSGMSADGKFPKTSVRFGEAEIYKQTLENSRSGMAVASIWIALRRMGLEGFRNYIIYQLEVCELFKQKIRNDYSEHFEVLNEHSNGWEIVFKPHFSSGFSWDDLQKASEDQKQKYIKTCQHFLNDIWYRGLEEEQNHSPVIGFVKSYSRFGAYECSFPAFLIHPCSLHYDNQAIDEMLKAVVQEKVAFDKRHKGGISKHAEEYFASLVPPR